MRTAKSTGLLFVFLLLVGCGSSFFSRTTTVAELKRMVLYRGNGFTYKNTCRYIGTKSGFHYFTVGKQREHAYHLEKFRIPTDRLALSNPFPYGSNKYLVTNKDLPDLVGIDKQEASSRSMLSKSIDH